MIRYQIPNNLLPGFQILAKLLPEQIQELSKIIKSFPVGNSVQELQKELKPISFLKEDDVVAITLFSFGELLQSNEETLESLVKELGFAYQQKINQVLSAEEREQLQNNLLQLFQHSENLRRTFKAYHLLSENACIYRRSRVLTDIRPIFDKDGDKPPTDGLIIHNLKLEYIANEELKEIFMSLDYNDILDLEKQLKRAREKTAQIKSTYPNLNFINIKE